MPIFQPLFLLLLLLPLALSLHTRAASSNPITIPLHRRPKRTAVPAHQKLWSPPSSPFLSKSSSPTTTSTLPIQPLYGDLTTLGEYYVVLTIDNQPINVQVDTGSSTLAVPHSACINCRPHDRRLTPSSATTLVACSSSACRPNTCRAPPSPRSPCGSCSKSNACCSAVDASSCGFFLSYADGSGAAGALVEADVTLAGANVRATFGTILRVSEDFETVAVDGILGMAFPSLACNPTCVTPLFDEIVRAGKVDDDIFSICTGAHGGALILGGSESRFYKGHLRYVALIKRQTPHFYEVAVDGVDIGGKRVALPDFSLGIVDSGTTVLVIAPAAYEGLRNYFQKHFCNVPGLCPEGEKKANRGSAKEGGASVEVIRVSPDQARHVWMQRPSDAGTVRAADDDIEVEVDDEGKSWFAPGYCALLTEDQVALLPSISIVLKGGVELAVAPEDYMLRYVQTSVYPWNRLVFRCLGITPLEGLAAMENNVIIGDSWLQKFFVEYDRKKMRLGFAPSQNCVEPGQELEPWLKYAKDGDEGDGGGMSPLFIFALIAGSLLSWILFCILCNADAIEPSMPQRGGYESIR